MYIMYNVLFCQIDQYATKLLGKGVHVIQFTNFFHLFWLLLKQNCKQSVQHFCGYGYLFDLDAKHFQFHLHQCLVFNV